MAGWMHLRLLRPRRLSSSAKVEALTDIAAAVVLAPSLAVIAARTVAPLLTPPAFPSLEAMAPPMVILMRMMSQYTDVIALVLIPALATTLLLRVKVPSF